ncbi:MAG: CARDB domain-containing protein [Solirubrobacteraceae bacterium]
MKRLTAGLSALLVGAAILFAGGAAGATARRAQLRAFACQSALEPANRSVSITAVMRPVPGTKHMSVRFDLLSAQPRTAPTAIHSGDLDKWIKPPNPTLGQLPGDVWNVQKQVVPLAAPATYSFRVSFRWIGAHKRILEQSELLSRRCHERELRPDLVVQSIAVTALPSQPHKDLYTAVIANQGNSAAGPFSILFAPGDGSATTTDTVALLRAHSVRSLEFVGPLCATGTAPTITADSALQIHDLYRANNVLTATCPAAAGG